MTASVPPSPRPTSGHSYQCRSGTEPGLKGACWEGLRDIHHDIRGTRWTPLHHDLVRLNDENYLSRGPEAYDLLALPSQINPPNLLKVIQ